MGFVNKSVPSALSNAAVRARGGSLSKEKKHYSIKSKSLLSQQ